MSFQPAKCKTMRVSRKPKNNINHLYLLKGIALDSVSHIKYLGVTISNDLRWNRHIHDICNRANKMLGLLRRNLNNCSHDVKLAAYDGLVKPILEYASCAWDPHTEYLVYELEKVQRRGARFITSNYTTSFNPGGMTELLSQLGWKSLQSQRKISRLILFNKGINDLAVLPLRDLTEPSRRFRNMHSMYYRPIFARKNIYKYSFLPRTIIDWNQLPQDIINLNSSTSFKNHIIDFIN